MSTQNIQFPQITIPDKEKNLDYHTRWAKAVVQNSFTQDWTTRFNILKSLYSFFHDGTGNDLTGWLQTAPDGSQMPGIWGSLNTTKTRLKVLIGELEERSYQIKVRALNSEAFDRKREEVERLRARRHLQEVLAMAEQLSGVPLEEEEYIPQSEEELKEYIDLNWKDKHAIIIEGILKFIAATQEWDESRKALFRDILIAGRCICINELIDGIPTPRRVDPMRFIFDPNSNTDILSDSTYFGEVDYIPLAQAAELYGLSLEELEEAYNTYSDYLGMGMDLRADQENHSHWGCMTGDTLKWFERRDGTPRCLIIKAVWRDFKTLEHKYEKNEKYGTEHLQDVSGQPTSKKDTIISNKIECWRQATLVGGKFAVNWGECPNQPRDLSKLHKSEPPYKVWVPDFLLGRSVSLIEQVMVLQLQKDIAAYQIQIQVARAIGRVLVIDEAFMPEGMSRESAMSYIKADGIVWANSKEYQQYQGNMNLMKDYDISLSESLGQYLSLIQYYDQQIDSITGVNEARQGIVQGSSQAVGVTNAAIFQSNLTTASFFKGFDRFCSRVLNHQAKLAKIAWAGKEKFAPIIGDVGVDFLREHIDISLDEFDVIAQSLPPVVLERQKLEEIVYAGVQSGEIPSNEALKILIEPDTTVAVRKYNRFYTLNQVYREQQAQQEMQMQQQQAQEQLAMQQQLAAMGLEGQMQLQQLKNQNQLQKTGMTGRVKLQSEKLKLFK